MKALMIKMIVSWLTDLSRSKPTGVKAKQGINTFKTQSQLTCFRTLGSN
ncbi:hypothetical protein VCR3J2_350358 [Vibrio coralliirubri]|nr:hypothetical protein VCR3J2_350358 [Vibrio coralliirubri]